MLENLPNHLTLSTCSYLHKTKIFLVNIDKLTFPVACECSSLLDLLLKFTSFKEKDGSIFANLDISKLLNLFDTLIIVNCICAFFEKYLKFYSQIYSYIILKAV